MNQNISKNVTTNENYIYVWERLNTGGIRLLHMYGKTPLCEVPQQIESEQVTELGEYCFSSKGNTENGIVEKNKFQEFVELADRYIEKIILPDCIRKIGRLAFYNCRNLTQIEMPADIQSVDGDAFMNCAHLSMLVMRGNPQMKSCLKQILAQISWLVRVRWIDNNVEKGTEYNTDTLAQACFFEYDQSYDEIGPAHIFKLNMNGEGFRARQSFNEQIFVWKQYDETFAEATAQESETDLLDMAFNRLIFPYELDEAARGTYIGYVREHRTALGKSIIEKRSVDTLDRYLGLSDLGGHRIADTEAVTDMIALASQADWGEGSVLLLRFKKKYLGESRKNRFLF